MILSENRFPLFGIMRSGTAGAHRPTTHRTPQGLRPRGDVTACRGRRGKKSQNNPMQRTKIGFVVEIC
jgi:hypothetical protein